MLHSHKKNMFINNSEESDFYETPSYRKEHGLQSTFSAQTQPKPKHQHR